MSDKFKNFDNFVEECGEDEPDFEEAWFAGWDSCKAKILNMIEEMDYYEHIGRKSYLYLDKDQLVKKINEEL
jgi:hypothetical protein